MTYDEFNQYCGSFKATSHVIQWGDAHVWKVAGKVFAIGGWGKDGLPAYIFKASGLNFQFLSDHEGYRPAPYFASRGMKWIQQTQTDGSLDDDLRYYISESYRIVALGLTKRKQKELGLDLQKAPEG